MLRRLALAALLALVPQLVAAQLAIIAPTQSPGDNGDRIATTAFVQNAAASTVTSVTGGNQTITTTGTIQTDSGLGIQNLSLSASVNSNILTVNVLDSTGATPSATSSPRIQFRSATANSGVVSSNYITAALSITTNAVGATLGSINNTAFRFWVCAFDNAGTTVLALFNATAISVTVPQIFPLDETVVATTVAMTAGATSAGVFYTPNGTTLTSKAFRILGYVEYNSTGLVTAGTYATAPNFIQLYGIGVRKPGEPVQSVVSSTSSADAGTTSTTFAASTFTGSITPKSAANMVQVGVFTGITSTGGTNTVECRVQRSTTWTGSSSIFVGGTANLNIAGAIFGQEFPNSSGALTYTIFRKTNNVATTAICPALNTQPAWMQMQEIMG